MVRQKRRSRWTWGQIYIPFFLLFGGKIIKTADIKHGNRNYSLTRYLQLQMYALRPNYLFLFYSLGQFLKLVTISRSSLEDCTPFGSLLKLAHPTFGFNPKACPHTCQSTPTPLSYKTFLYEHCG